MIKIGRLLKSFHYAIHGLLKIFREEQNLKIQIFCGFAVLSLAWYFSISKIELAILILAICIVLIAEIANSAVERITDVLKPRINGYVKEIKDIMAAAVLMSSIAAVAVAAIIFFSRLFGH